ncbi:hypothetical protein [Chryseobacterium defluvii]|uniref:Uncharacterized protein n=1 Tax=Chryseobacterium defluvii TaxID=160396 RepID=A0A495SPJ2_9FLAO|nr:hypothetical protein [Chryseobacterium defluvii]RKT01595.1 hypothetical protein BCF58_0818 [Chryseobacterium defluvii]
MNWIIRSTKIVKLHTNLNEILRPVWEDLKEYDWILTDLDFISDDTIPIHFDQDTFILNTKQFEILFNSRTQIIWGIISAVPKNTELNLNLISKLSAEDMAVWENDKFLIEKSYLEIIAFDSSYTIIKFTDGKLSSKFKEYFKDQALELEKYISKN